MYLCIFEINLYQIHSLHLVTLLNHIVLVLNMYKICVINCTYTGIDIIMKLDDGHIIRTQAIMISRGL